MKGKKALPGLKKVREKLSSAEQLGSFVDLALDALLEIMEADTGWLQLLTFVSGKTLASAWRGFTADMKREAESLVLKEAARPPDEADTVVVTELSRSADAGLASFVEAGFASLIVVPLRTNLFQGFLGAVSREPEAFSGQSADVLKLKASLIGAALEKGALSRGLADLVVGKPQPARYTRELKRIAAIAGRSYGEVRQAIDKVIGQPRQLDKKISPPGPPKKRVKKTIHPALETAVEPEVPSPPQAPPAGQLEEPAEPAASRAVPEKEAAEPPAHREEEAAEESFERHADRMQAFRKSHAGFR